MSNNTSVIYMIAKNRDILTTNEAAAILNLRPQTLRKWACLGSGPIRPININGRLAWKVQDIKRMIKRMIDCVG